MNDWSAIVFKYRLPLASPIVVRGSQISYRSGWLLGVADRWSEAAPLPGLSVESVDELQAWLRAQLHMTKDAPHRSRRSDGPASALFAIDTLAMEHQPVRVPINALLWGTPEQMLQQAQELSGADYASVKLKVGRESTIGEEIELVRQVRHRLRPDQSLRLDANRAWTWEAAAQFAKGLRDIAIEYIEEPLAEPVHLEAWSRESQMPYALDESLLEWDASRLTVDFPSASAYIVKPTLLGSLQVIESLAKHGKTLVMSGCFESGVGTVRIAQLADRYSPGIAVGLDTYRWLADDLLVERLKIDRGHLEVPHELRLDLSKLEPWKLDHPADESEDDQ